MITTMSASSDTSGPLPSLRQQAPASASESDGPALNGPSTEASTSWPPRRKRTTPRKRKVPVVYRPDEGSIYDIMHDNQGKSLYVLPICWTGLHATLLGASFTEGAPIVTPVPEPIPGRWLDPSPLARQLTDQLHTLVRSEASMTRIFCKNMAMKNAMAIFFPDRLASPKMNAELDIYFGHRVFRRAVRIPCLWKTPNASSFATIPTLPNNSFCIPDNPNDSFYVPNSPQEPQPQPEGLQQTPNMPILAYINKSQVAFIRQNLFRVVQTPDNANAAVASLQALRSKHLIPADADQDPYLVAMMVSMAQARFYPDVTCSQKSDSQQSTRSGNGRPFLMGKPDFEDTKVTVIAHDEGMENSPRFLVYTATVTADYMERWLYPLKVPQLSKKAKKQISLDITMTPVPFWPILGLKERLARALGQDIVGPDVYSDAHPDHIGFWDDLVEPRRPDTSNNDKNPPRNESNSRKRRAERQGGREDAQSSPPGSQDRTESQGSSQGHNSQRSATSSQSQRASGESTTSDSDSSQREPLSEVYNSSFSEEDEEDEDTEAAESDTTSGRSSETAGRTPTTDRDRERSAAVLSPNTKRRMTARSASAVEVR